MSLIDLFPTALGLLGVSCDYRGFGRPLWEPARENEQYLAQIAPLNGRGTRIGKPGDVPGKEPGRGLLWALFDERRKFAYDEESETGVLTETLTERVLEPVAQPQTVAYYAGRYARLMENSVYSDLPRPLPLEPGQEALIERRLRDLGVPGVATARAAPLTPPPGETATTCRCRAGAGSM